MTNRAMTSRARTTRGTARPWWRRALPWVLGWLGLQAAVAAAGALAAARWDEGSESSTVIRRVRTMGGLELRPTNPELAEVRLDLAMAGADLDLSGLERRDAGVDVTVRLLMGGAAIRVPTDWRVWWSFTGVGGMGGDGAVARTADEHAADLRVRARVLFGGVGLEGAG